MCQEHHDTDNQQYVNDAAGNVKGQESKQPRTIRTAAIIANISLTPLPLSARQMRSALSRAARIPTSRWIRACFTSLPNQGFEVCSI
jgi:hypothetical protein